MGNEWKFLLLVFDLLLVLGLTWQGKADDDTNHEELIKWLRSVKGGFFNEKVVIRRNRSDASSRFGMFASENIKAKELIFSIPPEIMFDAGSMEEEHGSDCGVVHHLIAEMKNNDSEFAPYMNYLNDQRTGQLPSAWSSAGKDLLLELLGWDEMVQPNLPPGFIVDWGSDWIDDCDGDTNPFDVNAFMMVIQRGWDDILVPVYDMMNHRNGHWLNTIDNSVQNAYHKKINLRVTASRDIEKGEELYTSSNFCKECDKRSEGYGTFEILRDYGIVESYPQRWIFEDGFGFELDEIINDDGSGSGELKLKWLEEEPNEDWMLFFEYHLDRLNYIMSENNFKLVGKTLPKEEWDIIVMFGESVITALKHAILSSSIHSGEYCLTAESCSIRSTKAWRYDTLKDKKDPLDYAEKICKFDVNADFRHYKEVEAISSHYQNASFIINPVDKDTCFELDYVFQICSSYRPHYHEMVVHYTARYLKDVKRVVWVGGGDSMLLHEILKYPNLELVVGLEIDQKVTRASFKYFGTQPHWDDPRVQWWYGDASKSLLMLPKEYYGSFDMVLVDLSETVTSNSVTEELSIFDALSLLLKPEGIFVKNEVYYIDSLSQIFNYAIQIFYHDVPVICGQYLSLGSNHIDFLYTKLNDHNMDDKNLFIKPLKKVENRYDIWYDYRKNNTISQLHCKGSNEERKILKGNSPGIIMIVEAEEVTTLLETSFQLKNIVLNALDELGVEVISSVLKESNDEENPVAVVITSLGYIIVRAWPEHNYCALDIHHWSHFQKQDLMKDTLLVAFGSRSSSSYRIVAGGMMGVPSWEEDEKNRGPRKTQVCNDSSPSEPVRNQVFDSNDVNVVFEESLALLQETQVMAAVVCGYETQPCNNIEILAKNERISEVISLLACPNLQHLNKYSSDSESDPMLICEEYIKTAIDNFITNKNHKLRLVVLDPSAPIEIAQIVLRLLFKNKMKFLTSKFLAVAVITNTKETWRRNWLERFRTEILKHQPLFRAEILFHTAHSTLELGVTSSGDQWFVEHLVQVTSAIETRMSLVSEVKNIYGGLANFQPNFDPQYNSYSDYDTKVPLLQWNSQQPVGLQSVFQLELKYGSLTGLQVQDALQSAVKHFDDKSDKIQVFNELGQGCLVVSLIKVGNVVAVWDGGIHIDINIFTFKEDTFPKRFVNRVMLHFPNCNIVLLDEQPRGYGRVVSFFRDIEPRNSPTWS